MKQVDYVKLEKLKKNCIKLCYLELKEENPTLKELMSMINERGLDYEYKVAAMILIRVKKTKKASYSRNKGE